VPNKRRSPRNSVKKHSKSNKNVRRRLLYVENKRKRPNYQKKSVSNYKRSKTLRRRSKKGMNSTKRKISQKLWSSTQLPLN
jgi:hypothetical protein